MTHLFIEPGDVLVFRDGRPFDAGSDHFASGPFPPLPLTIYGALRSALLSQQGADFGADNFGLAGTAAGDVVGTKPQPDSTGLGTLALTGLTLARRAGSNTIERLYPAPLDLLKRKTKADEVRGDPDRVFLRPIEAVRGVETNLPENLRLLHPSPVPHVGTFYEGTPELLTEDGWMQMLQGQIPDDGHLVDPDTVYRQEPRTQVSLRGVTEEPYTGTAQEGKLFTVEFNRLASGAGLAVSMNANGVFEDAGLLRLGGESRPARYEVITPPTFDNTALVTAAKEHGRVRVILTTPAPFNNGWRPDGIEANLKGNLRGVAVGLTTGVVGQPITLGGWDIVNRMPKPARPAVPSGSVYFLTLDDKEDAPALFANLDGQSLCSGDDDGQGLGLVRLGIW